MEKHIFSDEELDARFGKRFYLKTLAKTDQESYDRITKFIYYQLKLDEKKYKKIIMNYNRSDAEIYRDIRVIQDPTVKKKVEEDPKRHARFKVVGPIADLIRNKKLYNRKIKRVLDIGTEYNETLQEISRKFRISRKNVKGINIAEDSEFEHYTKLDTKNITIYDGVNIPFPDNYFDIVIASSVMHHVLPSKFDALCKDIKRVCKGIFIIKENDLTTESSKMEFHIQHELYEGVFFATKQPSHLNENFTPSDIKKNIPNCILWEINPYKIARGGFFAFKC
jgi:hypothetical protein